MDGINFEVAAGEYAVLMGKTGCGKTTLLELICGLRRPKAGRIVLHETDVTTLRPAERSVGYVPQDGALFDTMTVRNHLEFALLVRRWDPNRIKSRVDSLSEMLEISHILNRYPKGLSGGERQRVALGRAIAFEPKTLILDEPLSALDESTKQHMYEILLKIREQSEITALHVTHSEGEAEVLGDRILRFTDQKVICQ